MQDIARSLRLLGYEVDIKTDLNQLDMEKAVHDFVSKLRSDKESEGFFWFAGLGIEIGGENYLCPVDCNANSESLLRSSSIPLYYIQENLNSAGNKINVLFLDSCRDNPLELSGYR